MIENHHPSLRLTIRSHICRADPKNIAKKALKNLTGITAWRREERVCELNSGKLIAS